jgi:hypothetical protein
MAACSREDDAKKNARLAPPADESTGEQRASMNSTLDRIEALTRELGQPRTFRDLPIVVTTANSYTDHPAACVSLAGKGQFILIKPSVFDDDAEVQAEGAEDELFRVLLHEIGHCYFNRQHEEDRLFAADKVVEISADGGGTATYPILDASIMVPEELTAPVALEKYYVAELLGIERAKTMEDLVGFVPNAKLRNSKVLVRAP